MDAERTLGDTVYVFKRDHREESRAEKSQWRITLDQEIACFVLMREQSWGSHRQGWSLHLREARVHYLGVGVDRKRQLFLAKFLGEPEAERWHGYPADYLTFPQDIPGGPILLAWVELGYLSRAKMRKILCQQPCRIAT
jgi:hypothetical protein